MSDSRIDPGNMHGSIYDFPSHITEAISIGENYALTKEYKAIRNIVVAGLGGSAIGGDVVRMLTNDELSLPLFISRHYQVPNWVGESTLVICSSYSGNTEETLSAFETALARGAQICGISTGGELTRRMKALNMDVIKIPGGLQPRAALAYSFVPMLYLFSKLGFISDRFKDSLRLTVEVLKSMRGKYSEEGKDNPAYELARKIYRSIPVIYGQTETTSIIASRWKGQFCENAKMLAYHNELPELNHNEIVGWENNPDLYKKLSVIWLRDSSDFPRVTLRQNVTSSILKGIDAKQVDVSMSDNDRIVRLIHLIHFGDWVSYWCAILHQTDPTPVDKIDCLKNELNRQ